MSSKPEFEAMSVSATMPIVALGVAAAAAPVTFDKTPVALLLSSPFQRFTFTPMPAAIIACVPELAFRRKRRPLFIQGATPDCAPKPHTKYAAVALIAVSDEAFGTMNVSVWMGPVKSCTPVGRPFTSGRHVSGK